MRERLLRAVELHQGLTQHPVSARPLGLLLDDGAELFACLGVVAGAEGRNALLPAGFERGAEDEQQRQRQIDRFASVGHDRSPW